MRVISFHSYKGGRGRTTAIASIANLYARGGRNVALLDADVTAPWLHTRYGIPEDVLKSRGWLRGLLREIAETPPSVLPASNLDEHSVLIEGVAGGSLRLLAPGDPESDDYWEWMAEEFPRFLGIRADPPIIESWRDLRALIARAEPRPDVLLVDAPAGYHQASAYMAMAIADAAVFFAQADHADAEWTTQMVEMIRRARPRDAEDRYGPLELIGVRARYPAYMETDIDAAEGFHRFKDAYAEAGFDRWVSLESDPRIERDRTPPQERQSSGDLGHESPIPPSGAFTATHLVKGYAELLAVALGEAPATGAELLGSLPQDEVIEGARPQFFLLRDQGILLNPADQARNVSFRVETFCALLDDLHRELIAATATPGQTEQLSQRALAVAGEETGSKFGKSLATTLAEKADPKTDEARIRSWCEFDSRVGFGGLDLTRLELDETKAAKEGTIAVAGNFLAVDRKLDDEDPDLCPLLTGYIKGVLSMLLRSMPHDVEVSHPQDRCMGVHSGRTSCEFDFVVPGEA
jgi:cellulose biosynthesis protein BcsQ